MKLVLGARNIIALRSFFNELREDRKLVGSITVTLKYRLILNYQL